MRRVAPGSSRSIGPTACRCSRPRPPGSPNLPPAGRCACRGRSPAAARERTPSWSLEWLDFGAGGHDAALGRALAALHRHTAPRFGWHRDNTIGTTPSTTAGTTTGRRSSSPPAAPAARVGEGARFSARGAGRRRTAGRRGAALLAGHRPVPSLLHGDLWSGNAGALATGEPVLFDPAVYYGDREADLAMTELFGGFSADFHAAYRAAWPLDDGYERAPRLSTTSTTCSTTRTCSAAATSRRPGGWSTRCWPQRDAPGAGSRRLAR